MRLTLLRLLAQQRALYDMPRDLARFRAYLAQMTGGGDDIALPIVGMNPMGKDRAIAAYDALLAIRAEDAAQRALDEAGRRLAKVPGELKVALVVQDDAQGAWSQPEFTEAKSWEGDAFARRNFCAPAFLSSKAPYTEADVATTVLAEVYRIAWVQRHGPPRTLRDLLQHQGLALAFAGVPQWLGPAELARTRAVVAPHLDARADWPEAKAAMFGDPGAQAMGHQPLGLPQRAGFALGLADAQASGHAPEEALRSPDPSMRRKQKA